MLYSLSIHRQYTLHHHYQVYFLNNANINQQFEKQIIEIRIIITKHMNRLKLLRVKSIAVKVVFTFNASINCTNTSSVTLQPTNHIAISHVIEWNIISYCVATRNYSISIHCQAMGRWNVFFQSTNSIQVFLYS